MNEKNLRCMVDLPNYNVGSLKCSTTASSYPPPSIMIPKVHAPCFTEAMVLGGMIIQ